MACNTTAGGFGSRLKSRNVWDALTLILAMATPFIITIPHNDVHSISSTGVASLSDISSMMSRNLLSSSQVAEIDFLLL